MHESVMQRMWNSAHLSGGNAAYVEELYELFLHDPNAVPEEWRTYFQKLPTGGNQSPDVRMPRSAITSSCWPRTSAAPSRFPPVL